MSESTDEVELIKNKVIEIVFNALFDMNIKDPVLDITPKFELIKVA